MKIKSLPIFIVFLLLAACGTAGPALVSPPTQEIELTEGAAYSLQSLVAESVPDGTYAILATDGIIKFDLGEGEFVVISANTSDGAERWVSFFYEDWAEHEELTLDEEYFYHFEEGFNIKVHFFTKAPFEQDTCLISNEWNSFISKVESTTWVGENEFLTFHEEAPAIAVGTAHAYIFLADLSEQEFEDLRSACPIVRSELLATRLGTQLDAHGDEITSGGQKWNVVASTRNPQDAGFFDPRTWDVNNIEFGKQLHSNTDVSLTWSDGLPVLQYIHSDDKVTFEHLRDQDLSEGIYITFWKESDAGIGAILYLLEIPG